jgi:hypothetical protein
MREISAVNETRQFYNRLAVFEALDKFLEENL